MKRRLERSSLGSQEFLRVVLQDVGSLRLPVGLTIVRGYPMTLLNRATRFVEAGDESEGDILRDCVEDGGIQALSAVQLLAEHMYGGMTFNIELKAPAAYCLAAFGVQGLDALVELATRSPASKNISLCLDTLASIAAGAQPIFFESGALNGMVRARITKAARSPELREAARARLREFVLAIPDEEDALSAVGSKLSFRAFSSEGVANELFTALAIRRLAIGKPTLDAYENLVSSSPDDEKAFQAFFERHPQFLDPMAAAVWPRPDLAGARAPDFIIRRTDDTYLVIEIESPGKVLMTESNQLSAQATHAIAQATDYRDFLMERFPTAAAHFPRFTEPECLAVIGTESRLSCSQKSALARDNRSRAGLRVVGFDWLARRAEAVTRNVIETTVTVQSLRMM